MPRALLAACFGIVLGVCVGVIAAGSLPGAGAAMLVTIGAVVGLPAAVLGWVLFAPGPVIQRRPVGRLRASSMSSVMRSG